MPTPHHKSPSFLHVDMDSFRTMRQFYALDTKSDPSEIYEVTVPRFLEFFGSCGVKATFFVVGQDLEHPSNRKMAERILEHGHRIANHTHTHPFGLALFSRLEIRKEVESAHSAIRTALGIEPVGFRAPGYNVDSDVLGALQDLGYRYDSSVFPSILNPVYHIAHRVLAHGTDLPNSDLGGFNTMRCPTRPYQPDLRRFWRHATSSVPGNLWEFPVGMIPYLKLPMYANFLLLMPKFYFRAALRLATCQPLTFLFHAFELLDCSEIPNDLKRHPNAGRRLATKLDFYRLFIMEIKKRFDICTTEEYLERAREPVGAAHRP
ncbi:MAG: polysaccharide deacetylase family protein [Verrucomicrobiia bacterium]